MGVAEEGSIKGAERVEGRTPFDADTNFVDIHLDFPVSFEPYEMGMTPFMRALIGAGEGAMQIHGARLHHLNTQLPNFRKFGTLLKLYRNEKSLPFKLNIEKTFKISVASDKPQDVNAALYSLISYMMAAHEFPGQSAEDVEDFVGTLFEIATDKGDALNEFVTLIVDNKFLKNLQIDALEIYPRMLNAELAIRPALFLDFDAGYAENPVPMRVSAMDFEQFKDLYKDIAEVLGRQLVLVAGVNNLLKRGDANKFAPVLTKSGKNRAPATLDKFADIPLGSKDKFIDDPWHEPLEGAISNQLRNAIAHNKAEYDEITQKITYFSKKEGMDQDQAQEIYFLEFVRAMLISYREMHRLHHLIKALFYYKYLILDESE